MPPYGPDPVSKEEADEARARAAGQNSEHRDRNEPQSREKKDKDENHKGGRRGKENGKDAGPAEEGEEKETPWWAKWQVMVPVVAGAAILGLVCSALFSENVHKQVVEGSELQSRAASASPLPCMSLSLTRRLATIVVAPTYEFNCRIIFLELHAEAGTPILYRVCKLFQENSVPLLWACPHPNLGFQVAQAGKFCEKYSSQHLYPIFSKEICLGGEKKE